MSSSMMESSTTGAEGDVVQAGDLVEAQDQVGEVAHHLFPSSGPLPGGQAEVVVVHKEGADRNSAHCAQGNHLAIHPPIRFDQT